MKIAVQTGSEGPRHDPYHYEEWTVESEGHTYIIHEGGLKVWVEKDRTRINFEPEISSLDIVLPGIGAPLTLTQIKRAYRKMREANFREHRTHGGMDWRDGFPGEHFLVCACGNVIDSEFDEGEII